MYGLGERLMDAVAHCLHFRSLIREESLHVKGLVEERLRNWSPRRLRNEGFALFNLVAESRGSLFQDQVMRFTMKNKDVLPFHRFSNGDIVRYGVMSWD